VILYKMELSFSPPGRHRAHLTVYGRRGHDVDAQLSRRAVLLVEDDDDLRDALADRLRDEGVDVREARDGREALEALRDTTPDLVITDLMMPRVTGWELVSELQKRELARRVPVILITAAANVRNVPPGHLLFVKPLRGDLIADAVRKLLLLDD
jgi:CheY-like chemotaxis protein